MGKSNQTKGWLENYNDSKTTAPQGYVGDGYSNVGRNYSPAWGGQFEQGGMMPIAQSGARATRADSLAVLNSQLALNRFYDREVKAGRLKKSKYPFQYNTDVVKNEIKSLNKDNLKFYREKIKDRENWKGKGEFDKEYKKFFNLTPAQVKKLEYEGLGVTKSSNNNKAYYRDMITPMQNLKAPFALIDSRIMPQGEVGYDPINEGASDFYPGGNVDVYDYDPLAVTPFDMLTDDKKDERYKKYGPDGIPKSYIDEHKTKIKPINIPVKNTPVVEREKLTSLQPMSKGLEDIDVQIGNPDFKIPTYAKVPKSYNVQFEAKSIPGNRIEYYDRHEGVEQMSPEQLLKMVNLQKWMNEDYDQRYRYDNLKERFPHHKQEWIDAQTEKLKAQRAALDVKLTATPNYQDGGDIPMAQQGKNVKPIYVDSKNHPRYKAYNDSLSAYNRGKYNQHSELTLDDYKILKYKKIGYLPYDKVNVDINNPLSDISYEDNDKHFYRTKQKAYPGKVKPIGFNLNRPSLNFDGSVNKNNKEVIYSSVYKKPQQQVIVKPREEYVPLPSISRGLEDIDTQIGNPDISIPIHTRVPQSYDVTSQRQTLNGPSDYYNYDEQGVSLEQAVKAKQAADAYNQYVLEKYGNSKNPKAQERLKQLTQDVQVTPNYQIGGSVYPVNYVPEAQNGKLTFLQPTSDKLPEGYMKGSSIPSTERAMSIGGENGEPAYLIPSFKYGQELLGPVFDPISEFRRTGEHLGGPFKTWQEADEWERTVRHPAVENKETIMFPQEKFAMGGSLPGAVGFSYARTQGAAPSNGKYAKKTMASAQDGVRLDMYGAPITAIEVNDPSASRTSYDPRTNRMILGSDTNAENKDKAIAHENYHASKYLDNMMNYDIAHHTDNEQWARMQARPSMVSTDNVWSNYYDRKPREIDDLINNDINSSEFLKSYANTVSQGSPSIASGLIGDTIYDKVNIDKQLYLDPGTSEGEAQRYEDTGIRSYEQGGIIKDDRGQWDHPGEITQISGNTMATHGYGDIPLYVVPDKGEPRMVYPNTGTHTFPEASKFTEYPVAQQGKKVKDVIPTIKPFDVSKSHILTKNDKLTKEQLDFTKNWMNSPMYNQMVNNSTTGYFDKHYLNKNRKENFDQIRIQKMSKPNKNNVFVGADSNTKTGLIRTYPYGYNSPGFEGMIAHEASHSSDKPAQSNSIFQSWVDPYINGIRNIPQKDIDLMQSYSKGNKAYKYLFNKSSLKNKDLDEDREWHNYISDPTETRARLNDIRYNAKKYGVYDPFTQKATPESIEKIKELTRKAGDFDPFEQLKGIYDDEQILNLLNSVSQNDQHNNNPNIATAKDGKELVKLDQLTNFTNYNKPQPGGWLNKYN